MSARTVQVPLDVGLVDELVAFALEQGLDIADKPLSGGVRDAVEFCLGVAQAVAGEVDPELAGLVATWSCRVCGCTDERACVRAHPGGAYRHGSGARYDTCEWAEPGLCTACAPGAAAGWTHPGEQREAWAA
jgi:hypothetical protein